MKIYYNVYIILVMFLMLIQLLISGCTTTVTKDLLKEELQKEEVDLASQKLYQDKCSKCHELPDTDAYSYTSEQWAGIIDLMHDAEEAKEFITLEEKDKIKGYLKNMSQTR